MPDSLTFQIGKYFAQEKHANEQFYLI